MFRDLGYRPYDSHFNNVVVGFYMGGGYEDNEKYPKLMLTNIHTNVNVLQLRLASNVFKNQDRFFQFHRFFNEIDLMSS